MSETHQTGAEKPEEPGSYALLHTQGYKGTEILAVLSNERLSKDGKPLSPEWSLPGGGMEKNETPMDTVLRELQEEFRCPMELFTGLYPFPPDGSSADTTRQGRDLYAHVRKMPKQKLENLISQLLRAPSNPEVRGVALIPLSKILLPYKTILVEYPKGSGVVYPFRTSHVRIVKKFFATHESHESEEGRSDEIWDGKVPAAPKTRERGWSPNTKRITRRHAKRFGKAQG